MLKAKPFVLFFLIIMLLGTLCPLFSTNKFGDTVHFNLYQTDIRLFFICLAFIALVAFTYYTQLWRKFKFLTYFLLIWLLCLGGLIYLKSHQIIQLNFAEVFSQSPIQFQWGVGLLIIGALGLILIKIPKD